MNEVSNKSLESKENALNIDPNTDENKKIIDNINKSNSAGIPNPTSASKQIKGLKEKFDKVPDDKIPKFDKSAMTSCFKKMKRTGLVIGDHCYGRSDGFGSSTNTVCDKCKYYILNFDLMQNK